MTKFSLTTVDLSLGADQIDKYSTLLENMLLESCPGLEALHLISSHQDLFDASPLLQRGSWPRLTRISLGTVLSPVWIDPYSDSRPLEQFFAKHPLLEHVSLHLRDPSLQVIDLPNLKSLQLGPRDGGPVNFTSKTLSQFKCLIEIDMYPTSQEIFLKTLPQMLALRRLGIRLRALSQEAMEAIVNSQPLLERLHFTRRWPHSKVDIPDEGSTGLVRPQTFLV